MEQWIKNPEQLEVLTKSYKDNAEALLGLAPVKDGKMTDDIRKRANQVFLKELMPKFTPNGLEIPREMRQNTWNEARRLARASLA